MELFPKVIIKCFLSYVEPRNTELISILCSGAFECKLTIGIISEGCFEGKSQNVEAIWMCKDLPPEFTVF